MKKLILCIIGIFMLANMSLAETVSTNRAMDVAQKFYQRFNPLPTVAKKRIDMSVPPIQNVQTEKYNDQDTFYIISMTEGGFVLVSAEDDIVPILGYSFDSDGSHQTMSPAARQWFDYYSKQIAHAIAKGLTNTQNQDEWQSIENNDFSSGEPVPSMPPLLSTQWNQKYPGYNNYAPDNTYTGCVATAMAQIMKYFNYPVMGTGYHQYTHQDYGELSANFNTAYEWTLMPEELTTSSTAEEISAVALLIYHCGVSVSMDFGPDGSGASTFDVGVALPKYFYYEDTTAELDKNNYTEEQWVNMIIAEIDNFRPILYRGEPADATTGHAFVCDGYQGTEYFHFNWGWGGSYDGYYRLSALTPGTSDFTYDQGAVFGIQPEKKYERVSIVSDDFEDTFPSTGWTQFIASSGSPSPEWTQVSTGANPSCTPIDGNYMIQFNSSTTTNGAESRLVLPMVDLSNVDYPRLTFMMYHEDSNSSLTSEGVTVQVQDASVSNLSQTTIPYLTLPEIKIPSSGNIIDVPIGIVSNTETSGIEGLNFAFEYDTAVAHSPTVELSGILSESDYGVITTNENNVFSLSIYAKNANFVTQDGMVALVKLKSIGTPGESVAITVARSDVNEQSVTTVRLGGISEAPSDWTDLQFYPRYIMNTGWQTYQVDLTYYTGKTLYVGFLGHSANGSNIYLDRIEINHAGATSGMILETLVSYAGASISFTDDSFQASTYTWDLGDSTIKTSQNITHVYANPGIYTVVHAVNGGVSSVSQTIHILPHITPSYLPSDGGDFEINYLHFGTNQLEGSINLWELGQPGNTISDTASGTNVWKTDLDSNIQKNNYTCALYTPDFDLSAVGSYWVSFKYRMETVFGNCPGAAWMEYSTDQGKSWQRLGAESGNPEDTQNWYNKSSHGIAPDGICWWHTRTEYTDAIYNLTDFMGESHISFRFIYKVESTWEINAYDIDGFAIDDFTLEFEAPTADFTMDREFSYVGKSIAFTDASTFPTDWSWNFGDSATSNIQNPTHAYALPGDYTITLSINSNASQISKCITILPLITPSYLPEDGGDFESNPQHFLTNIIDGEINLWERGTPSNTISDTASGTNVWKTDLDSNIQEAYYTCALNTPAFNLSAVGAYYLKFKYRMEIYYNNCPGAAWVEYSIDQGDTWQRLGADTNNPEGTENWYNRNDHGISPDGISWWHTRSSYTQAIYNLVDFLGEASVCFRFVYKVAGNWNGGYDIDGFAIDDFELEYIPPTATFQTTANVYYADIPIQFMDQSTFPNNWAWDFEGITSTSQNVTHTFASPGDYSVTLSINNNSSTIIKSIKILPTIKPSYTTIDGGDFESNAWHFSPAVISGGINLWEHGTPSNTISDTASGTNVWKTDLDSNIQNANYTCVLYSPNFIFSREGNYYLKFKYRMQIYYSNCPGSAWLEYSVDQGKTWQRLGSSTGNPDETQNWYNKSDHDIAPDGICWWRNASSYIQSTYNLSDFAGTENISFRFVYMVDAGWTAIGYDIDGWSIDDFEIEHQTNAPTIVPLIQDQTIDEGNSFTPITLDEHVSDANHQASEITWTVTGQNHLSVNIDSNRIATITINNTEWSGTESILFTATDPEGMTDTDLVVFTVLSVNDPPALTEWQRIDAPSVNFTGVWGVSSNEIVAVTDDGKIYIYDGSDWTLDYESQGSVFNDVWVEAFYYFVAASDGIYLKDNNGWSHIDSGINYNGITGGSPYEFAAGDGYIKNFIDSSPNNCEPYNDDAETIHAVFAVPRYEIAGTISIGDYYAVGNDGTILYAREYFWTHMQNPSNKNLLDIWGISDVVIAVGENGTILARNDDVWQEMQSNTSNTLNAIWGLSELNITSVSESGTIHQFNGNTWEETPIETTTPLNAIWGNNDIQYIVGDQGVVYKRATHNPATQHIVDATCGMGDRIFPTGAIIVNDGADQSFALSSTMNEGIWDIYLDGVPISLTQIEAYVLTNVTQDHVIQINTHYDNLAPDIPFNIMSISASASNDIHAASDEGLIYELIPPIDSLQPASWLSIGSYAEKNYDMWGAQSYFFLGVSGIEPVLKVEYMSQSLVPIGWSSAINKISGVWGISDTEVFAVGQNGFFKFDGFAWQELWTGDPDLNLNAVFGISDTQVYFVGQHGKIFYYDGFSVTPMTSNSQYHLFDIWGNIDVFYTVGELGTILKLQGDTWTQMDIDTKHTFYGVWGNTENNVYTVSKNGHAYHFDGDSWKRMEIYASRPLKTIWGNNIECHIGGGQGTYINLPLSDGFDIPDQTIEEGEEFEIIFFEDYFNEPGLSWSAEGQSDLNVMVDNVSASIMTPDLTWTGTETIIFTAIDPEGTIYTDSVRFTMNPITYDSGLPLVIRIQKPEADWKGSVSVDFTVTETDGQNRLVSETFRANMKEGAYTPVNLNTFLADFESYSDINWTVNGQSQLTVTFDSDGHAIIEIPGSDWTGQETITFTTTDTNKLTDYENVRLTPVDDLAEDFDLTLIIRMLQMIE